jgi:hypothetical protein
MNRRGQRRRLLLGLAVVVVAGGAGAGWIATRSPHGDPDPGGRILAGLKTIESVVPADAEVMLRRASEPNWDSCDGREGTFGWNRVTASSQCRGEVCCLAPLTRSWSAKSPQDVQPMPFSVASVQRRIPWSGAVFVDNHDRQMASNKLYKVCHGRPGQSL